MACGPHHPYSRGSGVWFTRTQQCRSDPRYRQPKEVQQTSVSYMRWQGCHCMWPRGEILGANLFAGLLDNLYRTRSKSSSARNHFDPASSSKPKASTPGKVCCISWGTRSPNRLRQRTATLRLGRSIQLVRWAHINTQSAPKGGDTA